LREFQSTPDFLNPTLFGNRDVDSGIFRSKELFGDWHPESFCVSLAGTHKGQPTLIPNFNNTAERKISHEINTTPRAKVLSLGNWKSLERELKNKNDFVKVIAGSRSLI
jgi:hypothetical protein